MDHSFRILVIEDDHDTLLNLRDILELDGHEVITASCFRDVELNKDLADIGLIITDRKLPDGMIDNFLPTLKSRWEDAKIIVVTGYADMQSTIAALRLGVADYVIKPIIPDDIRTTVNRIAETRIVHDKLAEEQQFADEVLNTAEAIVLVLDLEGNVLRFNRYFQNLTGWTPDELRGKDWFETCIPEEDRERIREVFIATAHDVDTRGIVNDVRGIDQRPRKVRWSNTTLKRSDGKVYAVLAVGVDVSDLEEAQARSLQAERLAAIGQTMTALAHESRNALQRMKAATDVLAFEVEGNPGAQEDLQAIRRAAGDLEVLLEEVRSFAAPIQMQPTRTSLPHVWRRAWHDIIATRKDRDARLVESLTDDEENVSVDASRIEQVFRNLFENALAACRDPVRIEVVCRSDGDVVELICSDNGPGLNEEQKRKLFEPFYTTKTTGTGLGMSICRRIIEAHGGTIVVHPSKRGASFRIRLPRDERGADYKAAMSSP